MQAADLPLIRTVSRPTVHPDGTWAVVSVTRPDLDADATVGQLWRVPLVSTGSAGGGGSTGGAAGAEPRRLTRGFRDTAPRLSPDGALVAFLRAQPQSAPQLWVLPADGGEAVQVTDRKLGVSDFRWSPDGRRLAFLSREPQPGRYGSVEGIAPGAERPRRITEWSWTRNGLGYHRDRPQHVFLVDVPDVVGEPVLQPAPTAEGEPEPRPTVPEPRRLTTDDVDHSGIAFTPDGGSVGVIAEREQRAGQVATGVVRVLPLSVPATGGGSDVDLGTLGPQAIAFGPGGELYVVAQDLGAEGKDFVARNAALYVLSAWADPVPRRLTDPETQEVGGVPLPLGDGGVLLTLASRGTQQVVRVSDDGAMTQLTSGDVVVSEFAVGGGTLAVSYADPGTYGDLGVAALDGAEGGVPRPRTDFSAPLRATGLVTPKELTVTGRDGYPVHGWVAVPEGTGRHPTLLMIHGGPYASYGVDLFDETQVLVDAGYAVVYCNPRGSAGYGQAHGRAIRQAMGTVDLHDVLDFLDGAVATDGRLDGSRVGVLGGSYGGYLTAWTIAHDHRFAGAIVERGFLDPEVFFGTSDIGSFFGLEYVGETPEQVAAQSPQAVAGQVRTPTLVVHSELDLRCPLSQAERYYSTLKRHGVETELVVFPGENHELSRSGRPRHRQERFELILDWWKRHLPVG
ncbi:alpha/beta hydrolase family protein [Promicromonospora iranensis]|uniref:Dipeptidyl aminopeptidase/acylaminoacyl peptidase n=1 Tax=Promicromonospora iranensis TaxID=1105144 RepID=A0ABU2CMA0_9MICO|nr:S9 family peptidase [Promicromonospora iranensis]MDR7382464.1 dipeptidyl aminopeptidase/acylaminoacyl peptidase [Promicromonospora iranensis]